MLPKVSAILPTGYGEKYIKTALHCFLSQTYHDTGKLELVVVDNNISPILHLLPSNVNYIRCPRKPVGALRNIGTQAATGDICINWDEDDWSHPKRVIEQVSRLLESGKQVTGWHSIYFWDEVARNGYKYVYEPRGCSHPPYAMGTSQCYFKSWWAKHKYEEVGIEDWPFSNAALHQGQLDSCDAGNLAVMVAHSNSVCHPHLVGKHFKAVSNTELPEEFLRIIETPNIGETTICQDQLSE